MEAEARDREEALKAASDAAITQVQAPLAAASVDAPRCVGCPVNYLSVLHRNRVAKKTSCAWLLAASFVCCCQLNPISVCLQPYRWWCALSVQTKNTTTIVLVLLHSILLSQLCHEFLLQLLP